MDWLEFYKELYYKEIERKNILNDKFNVFLTIITILGGGYIFTLNRLFSLISESFNEHFCLISLIILLSFSILVLFVIIFKFMYEVYYEKEYVYLESAENISKKKEEFEKYYNENYEEYFKQKGKSIGELTDMHMQNNIIKNFIKSASKNKETNDTRVKNNCKLNKLILTTTIIVAITYILSISIQFNETVNIESKQNIINYQNRRCK